MDIDELRDPIEVWELAVNKSSTDLISLLRSDKKIGRSHREALALHLEGKLRPIIKRVKQNKHRKTISYLELVITSKMEQMRLEYKRISAQKHITKTMYREKKKIIDQLCKEFKADPEQFSEYLRQDRSRVIKSKPKGDWLIEQFQLWYEKEVRQK